MGPSIQGIKTRLDSRMSPLWLCPRLENCDQGSFIVKKDCFLATAELVSLVPPPGRAGEENHVLVWKVVNIMCSKPFCG